MSTAFELKNENNEKVDNLFSFHNGFTGEANIVKFVLASTDNTSYAGLNIRIDKFNNEVFESWSIKIAKGHTDLSEEEWDEMSSQVSFSEFGSEQTLTCRVYCPGGTSSNIYNPFILHVENA